MNKIKEMKKKTETIMQIQETIKTLRTDISKFVGFLDSHTLQECRNSQQAVLQFYGSILAKYSQCKDSLDLYVDEQEYLRIEADENRYLNQGKQSRKEKKIGGANEEFILAYLDTEKMLKNVEITMTKIDARVKTITENTQEETKLRKLKHQAKNWLLKK